MFVDSLKAIENIMEFFYLFIPSYSSGPKTLSFLLSSWQRSFHINALISTADS